jgi:hypothetical protein
VSRVHRHAIHGAIDSRPGPRPALDRSIAVRYRASGAQGTAATPSPWRTEACAWETAHERPGRGSPSPPGLVRTSGSRVRAVERLTGQPSGGDASRTCASAACEPPCGRTCRRGRTHTAPSKPPLWGSDLPLSITPANCNCKCSAEIPRRERPDFARGVRPSRQLGVPPGEPRPEVLGGRKVPCAVNSPGIPSP